MQLFAEKVEIKPALALNLGECSPRPVEDHISWFFEHILEQPRLAVACYGIGVTNSYINTSGSEPNLGQCIAVERPSSLCK